MSERFVSEILPVYEGRYAFARRLRLEEFTIGAQSSQLLLGIIQPQPDAHASPTAGVMSVVLSRLEIRQLIGELQQFLAITKV